MLELLYSKTDCTANATVRHFFTVSGRPLRSKFVFGTFLRHSRQMVAGKEMCTNCSPEHLTRQQTVPVTWGLTVPKKVSPRWKFILFNLHYGEFNEGKQQRPTINSSTVFRLDQHDRRPKPASLQRQLEKLFFSSLSRWRPGDAISACQDGPNLTERGKRFHVDSV